MYRHATLLVSKEINPTSNQKNKMNTQTIIANAANITVINDGQLKYPVLTAELKNWIAENGEITSANYDAFCGAVDCIGGTPGNAAMIHLCDELVDAGAESVRLN